MNNLKHLFFFCLIFIGSQLYGQAVGDFGSIANGNYNSSTTWGVWNGAVWSPAPGGAVAGVNYPDKTINVYILSGTTVVLPSTGPWQSLSLTVQATGKIWTNNTVTNIYLNIYGDINCNGIIGNGATFDGLSLGIEGLTCTATGTGTFDVSRIRKNTNFNPTTTFYINRDINLRFAASSQTQIYNNATASPSKFDVVVGVGATLNLTTNGTSTGNAAIDADLVSGGNNPTAGSFIINGTMIVSGTTYLTTNNTSISVAGITTVAGSNTVTAASTALLTVSSSIAGTGGFAGAFPSGTYITSIINATTFTVSNNALISSSGSTQTGGGCSWTINNGGILKTGQVSTVYSTINCNTTSLSTTVTTGSTVGLTAGSYISGTGINPGVTIVSITNATTFVISVAATSTATNSMIIGGGNAGHLLRVLAGGTMEVTGSNGFIFALPTTNSTYDIQNGSFFEYSAPGAQNVVSIPAGTSSIYGSSTNAYGYLKISGTGTKTMFVAGNYNISNDLNIVNTSGTPILFSNNNTIRMLGGNWFNYNLTGFDEGLGTVVFLGSNPQTINTPGGERFFKLTYSKVLTSTLQFNCPVNVISILAWTSNGPILLNGKRLTIESAATTAINNTASPFRYIISETVNNSSIVQWNIGTTAGALNYIIPFGKPGTPDYIPFTYGVAAGVTVGNLSVATYGTPANNLPWPISPYNVMNLNSTTGLLPDNRDATVDRFWEIDVTGGTPSATVTFTYAPSELPSLAPYNVQADMRSQWYDPGVNKWLPSITAPAQTTGTFNNTTFGLNTYGVWTLSSIQSPLPIKLLAFGANNEKEVVDLIWSTASETNNDFFTLERGIDGNNFLSIGNVDGAGNSNIVLSYLFVDKKPLDGLSYYRLKQTDFDGKTSYSDIVAVRRSGEHQLIIEAGPIPTKDILHLLCSGSTNFSPELYDLDGRLIKRFPILSSGMVDLDISDLTKGVYLLRITTNNKQKSLRIVKE